MSSPAWFKCHKIPRAKSPVFSPSEESAENAHQSNLEFLLPQALAVSASASKTPAERTTEFVRTQCHRLTISLASGPDAPTNQNLYSQVDAFLTYLTTSVRMTTQLYEDTRIEEVLAMMFDREKGKLSAALEQRARDLYTRWSMRRWSGEDDVGGADPMHELVARTALADVTHADAHGAALVASLADGIDWSFGIKDLRAAAPAVDIYMSGTTESSPSPSPSSRRASVPQQRSAGPASPDRRPHPHNPFYHPAMTLLEAAEYFHAGLVDAQIVVQTLLATVPRAEVAAMRLRKVHTFSRMMGHFVCMNELLRVGRRGWDLTLGPAELGVVCWEPLGALVEGLGILRAWRGCGWVGLVEREARLCKDGVGWVMVWKAEMEAEQDRDSAGLESRTDTTTDGSNDEQGVAVST